ncbi:MAG: GDP-mannose 4,6-dehydratase, partial [Kiritimatiellae bacterium]|nr:GDP-mannose 4,6-dehydratase [Kiritimatiellia bacterium]
ELQEAGHEVSGLDHESAPGLPAERMVTGDVRNPDTVAEAVRHLNPEACVHLAGIAFVPTGWSDPHLVFSVNLTGTINVLEAFRQHAPKARLLFVTSSEVYGRTPGPAPLTEAAPLAPANPYACSKMAADVMALLYARRYGMPAMTARPDNHTGPGQSDLFVTVAFATQLAAIAAGKAEPVLRVGNLDNVRDFTDARDVVRAYRLLVERGRAGEAYNIASGREVSVRVLLDGLCSVAGTYPRIEVDPQRYRPTDARPVLDTAKLRNDVGWAPRIPLQQTLHDIYLACRAQQGPEQ